MYQLRQYPTASTNEDISYITIASGVVFIKDKKVLLVKEEEEEMFSFPGGVIQSFESPEMTAIREIKEETDLNIILNENPLVFTIDRIMQNRIELVILFHFTPIKVDGIPKLGNDAKIKTWRSVKEGFEDCYPNVAYAANYYINNYGRNPGYTIEEFE